ncbi:MAG: cupin domain-containing protein [Pseudomonadota bacterium]
MPQTILFRDATPEEELEKPDPAKVLSGSPTFRTWNVTEHEDGTLFSGIWESTPGSFTVSYDQEWEFCHILSGKIEITPDKGAPVLVGPGDAFTIEPGFKGAWNVLETSRKHYVIKILS